MFGCLCVCVCVCLFYSLVCGGVTVALLLLLLNFSFPKYTRFAAKSNNPIWFLFDDKLDFWLKAFLFYHQPTNQPPLPLYMNNFLLNDIYNLQSPNIVFCLSSQSNVHFISSYSFSSIFFPVCMYGIFSSWKTPKTLPSQNKFPNFIKIYWKINFSKTFHFCVFTAPSLGHFHVYDHGFGWLHRPRKSPIKWTEHSPSVWRFLFHSVWWLVLQLW